jgi:C4-type Zn-finger protein
MAFDCKNCGFRNNEVKGGGAVPTFGTEVCYHYAENHYYIFLPYM